MQSVRNVREILNDTHCNLECIIRQNEALLCTYTIMAPHRRNLVGGGGQSGANVPPPPPIFFQPRNSFFLVTELNNGK
jgi:hypothetical protein